MVLQNAGRNIMFMFLLIFYIISRGCGHIGGMPTLRELGSFAPIIEDTPKVLSAKFESSGTSISVTTICIETATKNQLLTRISKAHMILSTSGSSGSFLMYRGRN